MRILKGWTKKERKELEEAKDGEHWAIRNNIFKKTYEEVK